MKIFITLLSLSLFIIFPSFSFAGECTQESIEAHKGNVDLLQEDKRKCEEFIGTNLSQQNTLKQAIQVINSKIVLAQAQISQTIAQINSLEKDIEILSQVVSSLTSSQDKLGVVYAAKVVQYYKHRIPSPLALFLSSDSFASFFTKLKYLNLVRTHDRLVLGELEKARTDYDQQKQLKQKKQDEIETLKKQLDTQKAGLANEQKQKKVLLTNTQNDEKRYQALRAAAEAELRAIEAIIAGHGSETEVGIVNASDTIAHVIPSASACSTGAHLHFEVVKSQADVDPANLLSAHSVTWSNAPDSSLTFSGSWSWPLDDPIRITQTFGLTSYARTGSYGYFDGDRSRPKPHTGIDMVNDSLNVKAVKNGTLYRGSIACGDGTLKYVHVKNKDDNYDVYYLHVNYF